MGQSRIQHSECLSGASRLRERSYFPDWLLQPRRRAEQAFVSVIADAYLAGVSTRRVRSWCSSSVWSG